MMLDGSTKDLCSLSSPDKEPQLDAAARIRAGESELVNASVTTSEHCGLEILSLIKRCDATKSVWQSYRINIVLMCTRPGAAHTVPSLGGSGPSFSTGFHAAATKKVKHNTSSQAAITDGPVPQSERSAARQLVSWRQVLFIAVVSLSMIVCLNV